MSKSVEPTKIKSRQSTDLPAAQRNLGAVLLVAVVAALISAKTKRRVVNSGCKPSVVEGEQKRETENVHPREYKKTKAFEYLDLTVKALSALGVIILGIAGLLLQQQHRRADNDRVKQETASQIAKEANKRHLLTLKTLEEIVIVLTDAEKNFSKRMYTASEGRYMCTLGALVSSLAESLVYPDAPPVKLIPLAGYPFLGLVVNTNASTCSLRGSLELVAEVLQVTGHLTESFATNFALKTKIAELHNATVRSTPMEKNPLVVRYSPESGTLHYMVESTGSVFGPFTEESRKAWAAWYPAEGMYLTFLDATMRVDQLCRNQRLEVQIVMARLLNGHPELSEQFLSLREAIRLARPTLLPIYVP